MKIFESCRIDNDFSFREKNSSKRTKLKLNINFADKKIFQYMYYNLRIKKPEKYHISALQNMN